MKKNLLLLVMLCIVSLGKSQNSAYPDIPYTNLYGVAAEGDNIIAAGTCDMAMVSSDGGDTWQYFNIDVDFNDLVSVPGSGGTQAYLIDREEVNVLDMNTMSVEDSGIDPFAILSGRIEGGHSRGDELVVVGAFAPVIVNMTTMDFQSLGEFSYPSNDVINSSSLTDNYLFTSTRLGKVFRTDLSGGTEEIYDFSNNLRNISFGTDLIGYASVSGSNNPFKTTDGGVTWNPLNSFSESSTVVAQGENVVFSQNTNRLVISTDGGATAEYVSYMNDSRRSLIERSSYDKDGNLYLVGGAGMVLKSSDNGKSHDFLNAMNRSRFAGIDMLENGKGIAAGGVDLIVITEDGGDTWTPVDANLDDPNKYINDCAIMNDGTMLVAYTDSVLKIENGGATVISEEDLESIIYTPYGDALIGFKYQAGSYVLKKSTDGGLTWETKTLLSSYGRATSISSDGTIFVADGDGGFFISEDDGETWENFATAFGSRILGMDVEEDLALMSAGNTLYKTTDAGENWTSVSTGYLIQNIVILSEDHYVYTNAQNSVTTVRETKDGGQSWKTIDNFCTRSTGVVLLGDKYWLSQDNGHLNYVLLDLSTSTEDIELQSNYLINTMVHRGQDLLFTSDDKTFKQVIIYDQMGNVVLRNNKSDLGANTIQTEELSAGIYFIQFGKTSKAEKFVVLN